jgi:putative membrane protein
MKSSISYILAAISWLAFSVFLAAGTLAGEALNSQTFVEKAAFAGMMEIGASKAALSNSQDPQVREFADRMVQDHNQAGAGLAAAAKAARITPPTQLDPEDRDMLDALRAKSGEQFDAAYSQQMVSDHEKAVALFQSAANSVVLDPALVAYARETLPTLQAHKGMADTLSASMQGGASTERMQH